MAKVHGGKREGTGRKARPKDMVRVVFYIEKEFKSLIEKRAEDLDVSQNEICASTMRRSLARLH